MPGEANLESGGQGTMQNDWDNFQQTIPQNNTGEAIAGNGEGEGNQSSGDVKTEVLPPGQIPAGNSGESMAQAPVEPPTGQQETPGAAQIDSKALSSIKAELDALRGELETTKQRADYYQTQFNERYMAGQGQQPPQQASANQQQAPAMQHQQAPEPDELPEGVLPPEEWQSQSDMVPFFEHKFNQRIQQTYQQAIRPMFDRVNQVLGALEEMVVSTQFKDFKDVTSSVMGDLFSMDPSGKVIGIKDPATLSWIQQSPMPRVALYKYAQSKMAPALIKKTAQETAENLLNQLDRKPKITQPESGGAQGQPSATLDWDTSKEQADAVLAHRGLI